jgi:hypothetical protein
VSAPPVPQLDAAGEAWARNEIDHFVYAKLRAKGIRPSAMAAKAVYLRRVTLDLTGLPPTPAEARDYLSDTRPGAEERLVDRLLASPRYGERWGRHWLDVVRYSDSDGFKQDDTRPDMWRYRDWVIQSWNGDKPFDRFIREQIAADELYPGDKSALPGLGFLRLLEDKFDPLLHKDYYRFQAFFANMRIDDEATSASDGEVAAYEAAMKRYREAAKPVLDKIDALLEPARAKYRKDYTERFPPEVQEVILKPASARAPMDWQIYHKAITQVEAPDEAVAARKLNAAEKARYKALVAELEPYAHLMPKPLPRLQVMRDQDVTAPATHVLKGGAIGSPLEEVEPGWLSILDASPAKVTPKPELRSSGRRSALANILADPANPLTTRVIVNRVWHCFDAPLAIESCGRRQETVTPDQALELMNASAAAGFAKALAARVANDAGQSPDALVDRAFRLTLGREPAAKERERGAAFLAKQALLAGGQKGALEDMCLSLLSSSEFLYVD